MADTPITLRRYTNFDDMKAEEYRYWRSRPVHERMDAIEELVQTAYGDEARTRRCWESHLARGQWLSRTGYRRILEQAVATAAARWRV